MLDLILTTISVVVTGFVTMKVWAWLVVPIFGFAALSFAQAIALRTCIWYLQPTASIFTDKSFVEHESYKKLSDAQKSFTKFFAWQFVSCAMLLVAWILTFFI